MAKSESTETDQIHRIVNWVRTYRVPLITGAVVLAVALASIWFVRTANVRRQAFADRALRQARFAAESGNLPLAANDLSSLISNYSGTPAAQEASLILARVRLLQGQPDVAIAELTNFLASNPLSHFLAPAYALLASAYEDANRMAEAGEAYLDAAEATEYVHVRAQWLLDAGRSYTLAGDTARAAELFNRVASDFSEAPAATEALVRLGELNQSLR